MSELHLHLHIDEELCSTATSIHLHLTPSHVACGDPSGWTMGSGGYPIGYDGTSVMTEQSGATPLQAAQRIRPKLYELLFLSSPGGQESPLSASSIKLELCSGNAIDPVVWESFEPDAERGLWRLCVRRDFGRLLGTLTYARDGSAIWMLSDWNPRERLVLQPLRPERESRMLLVPIDTF